jgi:hypothetical protein
MAFIEKILSPRPEISISVPRKSVSEIDIEITTA